MISPRLRVITDNDYAGDPDGLFQLAHLLLSPSVDVRAVIGSHLQPGEEPPSVPTATRSRSAADEVVRLLGLEGRIRTFDGSNSPIANRNTPAPSPAAEAIVAEAMSDSALPLYVTLGGGLTQLASAYLLEPRIADRLTAIWIGGTEYPGIALPPPMAEGKAQTEYNTTIDIAAAQVVFDSPIPLWQVPARRLPAGAGEHRRGGGTRPSVRRHRRASGRVAGRRAGRQAVRNPKPGRDVRHGR